MHARRRDVRVCRDLIEGLYKESASPADFLRAVGTAARGNIEIIRPTRDQWRRAGTSGATGLTLPFPGGWLTIIPQVDVAEDTIFGHEAAHILFGDVPHWDKAQPSTREHIASLGNGEALPLLTAAATGQVESSWRHKDNVQEQRAELFGSLFESRRRRPDRYVVDRIDDFFKVGNGR